MRLLFRLLLLLAVTGCARQAPGLHQREHSMLAGAGDFGMRLTQAGIRGDFLLSDAERTVNDAHRVEPK